MAVYISNEASEINHSQASDESEAEGSDPGVVWRSLASYPGPHIR